MKIEYDEFGGFEMTAENGMDNLWFKEMVENVASQKEMKIGGYFSIDMASCNVLDFEKNTPAKEMDFNQSVDDERNVWGTIEKIRFSPFPSRED